MSNRRPLSWNSALRSLKADHLTRPDVREERLRPAISGWRGKSGRRYVFAIEPLTRIDADDMIGALAIFITRDAAGIASIAFGQTDPDRFEASAALRKAREHGCTEAHLHRLSDADEHAAILADLNAEMREFAL